MNESVVLSNFKTKTNRIDSIDQEATMFFMNPWMISLLAAAAATANEGPGQRIEAESLYFENGEYVEDEHASGGEYVSLNPGGKMLLDYEVNEGNYELTLMVVGSAEAALISARIEGFEAVTVELPASTSQTPIEVSIGMPLVTAGIYPVWIEVSDLNSQPVSCDWCTYDPPVTPSCTGCDLAPMAPPVVTSGDGARVTLPPIPGVGQAASLATAVYSLAVGSVSVQTAQVHKVTTSDKTNGSCKMKPPATGGGPDTCQEETKCSVTSTIKFTANNYLRWPFWDSKEKVVNPLGQSEEFVRQGIPFTRSVTVEIGCDDAKNITWTFEKGGVVTQAASCNKCQ